MVNVLLVVIVFFGGLEDSELVDVDFCGELVLLKCFELCFGCFEVLEFDEDICDCDWVVCVFEDCLGLSFVIVCYVKLF